MSTPNFRRGMPSNTPPVKDGSWLAKYNGSCAYCGSPLNEGVTRVRWNEERTQVVCATHR